MKYLLTMIVCSHLMDPTCFAMKKKVDSKQQCMKELKWVSTDKDAIALSFEVRKMTCELIENE